MSEIITVWEFDGVKFVRTMIIDDYYSLLWADRYDELGDFELELPISYSTNNNIKAGRFITVEDSDGIMIINDINPIESETDSKLVVKGVSGEDILFWRVLEYAITEVGANLVSVFSSVLNDNLINPVNPLRKINSFSYDFPSYLNTYTIDDQYDIQLVGSFIRDVCSINKLGFKVVFDKELLTLTFSVYEGIDRSYYSGENSLVMFSDKFDNVFSSSYFLSTSSYKNVAVVITKVPDPLYEMVPIYLNDEPSGFYRRETVVEANDITGEDLTTQQIELMIFARGVNTLYEYRARGVFDGEVDVYGVFKINEDFFIGDIVQCMFSGKTVRGRVIEVVKSVNNEGITTYISFDFDIDE